MSKLGSTLALPPMGSIQDRAVVNALQAISNWSRTINPDYVTRDELNLSAGQVAKSVTETVSLAVPGMTLAALQTYLNSSATQILANSPNLIQTDPRPQVGLKIGNGGIVAYKVGATDGTVSFSIDAQTGEAVFSGRVLASTLEGVEFIRSDGYIEATGQNATASITVGSTTYNALIYGHNTRNTGYVMSVAGESTQANGIGVGGVGSGTNSVGVAGAGSSAGLYGIGIGNGLGLSVDGNSEMRGGLKFTGALLWHNNADGNDYDVVQFIYKVQSDTYTYFQQVSQRITTLETKVDSYASSTYDAIQSIVGRLDAHGI